MLNVDIDTQTSVARLVELEKQLDELESKYRSGKVSLDNYNKSSKALGDEADGLAASLKAQNKDMELLIDKYKELQVAQEESNKEVEGYTAKVEEYHSSWEKAGSTANTALSVISASISKTNPELASMLGSVQKLIPNLTELGNAYTKIGENSEKAGVKVTKMGKLLKAATSPAGIMLLITAVATLVTNFDNIAKAIGISEDKIKDFKESASDAIKTVISWVTGLGNSIANFVITPFKTLVSAFKKVLQGDIKGAIDDFKNGIKQQFSFGKAFNVGKEWGEGVVDGIRDRRDKAKNAGKDLGKSVLEGLREFLTDIPDIISDAVSTIESELKEYDDITNQILSTLGSQYKGKDVDVSGILSGTDKSIADFAKSYKEYLKEIQTDEQNELDALRLQYKEFTDNGIEATEWYNKKKAEITEKYRNAEINKDKEALAKQMDNFASYASSVSSVLSTVTDAIESNLETELEAGRISDKEYEERKKALKAFQIANIVTNTAAGVASTWAAYTAHSAETLGTTSAVDLAAAIAQTATIVASGIAGISSIKSESLSGSSVSSSAVSGATGTTQVYSVSSGADVDKITNAVTAGADKTADTKVVLVVEDLNKVTDNMQRAEVESSF